jgi:hypothetical protein
LGNCVLYLHWCFNVILSSVLLHCNGEVFSLESIGLDFAIADVSIFRQVIGIWICAFLFFKVNHGREKRVGAYLLWSLFFYVNGFVNIRDRFEIRTSMYLLPVIYLYFFSTPSITAIWFYFIRGSFFGHTLDIHSGWLWLFSDCEDNMVLHR